jgi:hypothetical protein
VTSNQPLGVKRSLEGRVSLAAEEYEFDFDALEECWFPKCGRSSSSSSASSSQDFDEVEWVELAPPSSSSAAYPSSPTYSTVVLSDSSTSDLMDYYLFEEGESNLSSSNNNKENAERRKRRALAKEFLTRDEVQSSLAMYDEDGFIPLSKLQGCCQSYIKELQAKYRTKHGMPSSNERHPLWAVFAQRIHDYPNTVDLTSSQAKGWKKSKKPNKPRLHKGDRLSVCPDTVVPAREESNGSSANLTVEPVASQATKQVEKGDVAIAFLTRPEEECSLPLYDEDGLLSKEEVHWLSLWYIKDLDLSQVRCQKNRKTPDLIEPHPYWEELAKRLPLYPYTLAAIDSASSRLRGWNKFQRPDPDKPHPCRKELAARLSYYPEDIVDPQGGGSSSSSVNLRDEQTYHSYERNRVRALVKIFRERPGSEWGTHMLDEKGLGISKKEIANNCYRYIRELGSALETRIRQRVAALKNSGEESGWSLTKVSSGDFRNYF